MAIERICEICSTSFTVYPYKLKSGRGRFCSQRCKAEWWGNVPLEIRFRQMLGATTESGCILWNGRLNTQGYGIINLDKTRKKLLAHRAAYLIANGPFDKSLHVLHHCDTPKCVNHKHLFLGTQQDNMADKVSKNRQLRGKTSPLAKLTDALVLEIRQRWQDHIPRDRMCVQIANDLGLNPHTVYLVATRRRWKHL